MGTFRLFLALAVLSGHAGRFFGVKLPSGTIAVESFFVISGFYMALILKEKYNKKNAYYLFITNRFLRIFSMYWSVLVFIILGSVLLLLTGHTNYFSTIYSYLKDGGSNPITLLYLFVSNLFIFGQGVGEFMGVNFTTGNLYFTFDHPLQYIQGLPSYWFMLVPQAWTIELELLFYLIAPFILKLNLKLTLLILIISLSLRYVMFQNGFNYDPWTYRVFPLELAFFTLGIFSYYLYKKIDQGLKNSNKNTLFLMLSSIITCVLLTYVTLGSSTIFNVYNFIVWSYFASLIPFIALLFTITKNIQIDRNIGELSYPVYLIHFFFVDLLNSLNILTPYTTSYMLAVAGLSILVSYISIKFIADPINNYRQGRI